MAIKTRYQGLECTLQLWQGQRGGMQEVILVWYQRHASQNCDCVLSFHWYLSSAPVGGSLTPITSAYICSARKI